MRPPLAAQETPCKSPGLWTPAEGLKKCLPWTFYVVICILHWDCIGTFILFLFCEHVKFCEKEMRSNVNLDGGLFTSCHMFFKMEVCLHPVCHLFTSCPPSWYFIFMVFYNFYSYLVLGVPIQAMIVHDTGNIPFFPIDFNGNQQIFLKKKKKKKMFFVSCE